METLNAVVATRLLPPRVSRCSIPRTTLLHSLHAVRHSRLVLLTAPAGYGKTNVMAQWRQRLLADGARVAWLALAAEDDDPRQLCARLEASLRQAGVQPRRAGAAPFPDGAGPAALLPALAALVALLDGVPGEVYLMLDGFDHLRQPATLAFLQDLLRARLPHLHLVATARGSTGLALARLRAGRELAEFGSAALAFTLAETLAFVGQRADGCTPGDSAQAAIDTAVGLHELTEGWPAGLELAAAWPDTAGPLQCGWQAPASLQAYWREEVTATLAPALLDFLQRIAVPRQVDAALAAQLTGAADAGQQLAQIAARGLFLDAVPGHAEGGWYRLHPLFRSHLLHELACAGPAGLPALHVRTAAWLARHGQPAGAIAHALQGDDFECVQALVAANAAQLPGMHPLREFLQWADRIAPARLAAHPALLLAAAWACVVSARPRQAEHWIRQWEASAAHGAALRGIDAERHATVMRATIAAQRDDLPRTQALLDTLHGKPAGNPELELVRMSLGLRCAATLGQPARSRAPFRAAAQPGATELGLLGGAMMAMMAWQEGNAYEALRLGRQVLALAQQAYGRRSIAASVCAVPVAAALYEQDRIDMASEVLAGPLQTLRTGTPDVLIEAGLCHARLQWLAGARQEALAELAEAEAMFHRRGLPRGVARMVAERQRIVLAGKDLRHAQRLQGALDELERHHAGTAPRDQEIAALAALGRARLALAAGEPASALAALVPMRGLAIVTVREPLMASADLLQAAALDTLYRSDEAAASLQAALAAGERLGLVRTFADEGACVQALLDRAAPCGTEYLARLRAASAPAAVAIPAMSQPSPPPKPLPPADAGKGRQLTRREREILALLEQSMSNKRIALALNLSVDTVKWNLRQIYAKLEVSRRYDAILVARSAARHAD
ncbi:AAA family ATPase [Cupriavidus sp. P-10]|uniref:LuxR C-terminal-related transcriptional regulator n=1 Tax=Cupriavidus sp. P-10 TaxID=2027911 RepID=UPI000EC73134|nr:LuxR C-terminal-related transcriptional regulator [Cupriavidus sp. P-10]BDB23776.1 AAA family ATPase [Cupriavidus sp. P-10]